MTVFTPIGSTVVPFRGLYLGSYKVIPKRNYHGAYGQLGEKQSLQLSTVRRRSIEASVLFASIAEAILMGCAFAWIWAASPT